MTPYRHLNGDSNVVAYEATEDSIHVIFKNGTCRNYLYNAVCQGRAVVEQMKAIAVQGRGLNSYISSVVKGNYTRKW